MPVPRESVAGDHNDRGGRPGIAPAWRNDRMTAGLETAAALHAASQSGLLRPDDSVLLEGRGWSSPSTDCEPKIVAIHAMKALAPAQSVATVSYTSRGNV